MKRQALITGGNFGPRKCKNETDVYTTDDIVDMPVEDIYKASNGHCFHRESLIYDINNQIQRGIRRPIYPHNRQRIPSSVLGELGIEGWEARQQRVDTNRMEYEDDVTNQALARQRAREIQEAENRQNEIAWQARQARQRARDDAFLESIDNFLETINTLRRVRRRINGGNFGPRKCKNESDVYTLDDIVDMPVEDIYKTPSGQCYHRESLITDITNQLEGYRNPIYPNRARVSRSVLAELGIRGMEEMQRTFDREEMRAEEAQTRMTNALNDYHARRSRPPPPPQWQPRETTADTRPPMLVTADSLQDVVLRPPGIQPPRRDTMNTQGMLRALESAMRNRRQVLIEESDDDSDEGFTRDDSDEGIPPRAI